MSELTGGGGLTNPGTMTPGGDVSYYPNVQSRALALPALSAGLATPYETAVSGDVDNPTVSASKAPEQSVKVFKPTYMQTSRDSVGNVKPINAAQTKLGKLLTVLQGGLQGGLDAASSGALDAVPGRSGFGAGIQGAIQMPLIRQQHALQLQNQNLQNQSLQNQLSLLPFQRANQIATLNKTTADTNKTNAETAGLPFKQRLEAIQADAAKYKEVDGVLYDVSGGTPKPVPNAGNFVPADESTAPILGVPVGTKVPLTTAAKASQIATTREGKELQKRSQDIQIRGQNMQDARAREFNDIKREDKITQKQAADENQLAGFNSSMDRLGTAANELLNHPGLGGITGLRGSIPNIPGSPAADAQAKLGTLKSQVAFSVLQDMRNQSKTGGALGNVSDREEAMLSSNLAALDKAQSLPAFKQALQKIIDYTNSAKDRARQSVDRIYGKGASPSASPTTGARPAGATMQVPGSDGQLHWSDGKSDLGVVQ